MNNKTALIIGIGGFVGPYLKKELNENNYIVYGCGRRTNNRSWSEDYVQLDITNSEEVLSLIEHIKPDLIFNLAAMSSVSLSWKEPQTAVNINVIGTLNILEAVRATNIDSRLILIGSSEEYAPSDKPVDENSKLEAVNPYGITRIVIEEFAEIYRDRYGLNITCIRAFNHTGPGQTSIFVLPSFIEQVANISLSKKPGQIKVGNLEVYRDFSDVRDVVVAYRLVAECSEKLKFVNVGSGKAHQLRELLNYIISLSDQSIEVAIDPDRFRPADLPFCCCDNSLLQKATGWQPKRVIFETLKEMYEIALGKSTE